MSTSILTVFAQSAGVGHALCLTAEETKGIGITCSGVDTTLSFNVAMYRAFITVWNVLGGPAYLPAVECRFSSIGREQKLPRLDGGSLYGAFSLVLMQFFAMRLPAQHLKQLREHVRARWAAIQNVDLSTVAVSAEAEPGTGDFCVVDGIDQKLVSLARLEANLCYCVLAPGQIVPSVVNDSSGVERIVNVAPTDYLRSRNLRQIPIIFAHDPIDAFGQIFERGCKELAGQIA
jgi:hypothetical protein